MGADLGDERDVKFFPRATRNLLDYFIITVADEALNEFVGERAVKVELVPVFLVHVPGTCDFGVGIAEREGVIGVALEHKPFRALQVNHRKDAPPDAKGKGGFVKGEVLSGEG